MNDYPEYVEVEGKRYKINTDFRVAIECNRIAQDETIGDFERVLGVICTLFGTEAIDNPNHYEKLLKLALKYLSCDKDIDNQSNEEPYMDYIEDRWYISSSFEYDYKYDPYEMEHCHWYKFFNDLNNLSNSEIGNCCVLNKVINLRKFNPNEIKDFKERDKIIKAKELVKLKKHKKETKVELTEAQQKSVDEFYKSLGF